MSYGDKYIAVSCDTMQYLFTEPNKVKTHIGRGRMLGDYEYFELRVNVVPYKEGSILLQKIYRRHEGGSKYYTAEIPRRVVRIPDYLLDARDNVCGDIKQILMNNAYIALSESHPDEHLMDAFHYGPLNVNELLKEKGLHTDKDKFKISIDYSMVEWVMNSDDHCIDVYLFVEVSYAAIESEFIYVATDTFEQYCESKYPESYAVMLAFSEDEYDENSSDFRMNKDGKYQICAIIKILRSKRLI